MQNAAHDEMAQRRQWLAGILHSAFCIAIVLVTAPLGLADGSFERSPGDGAPSEPWTVLGGAGHVIREGTKSEQGDMPTDGDHWASISSDSARRNFEMISDEEL